MIKPGDSGVIKKTTLPEHEIDKRIEALGSLMGHWAWPIFVEMVQYMQGGLQMEIFTRDFTALDPIAKDKRHATIVEALRQLDRILQLPDWLSKKKPSRWAEVTNHALRKEN